jgi:predicted transport protein
MSDKNKSELVEQIEESGLIEEVKARIKELEEELRVWKAVRDLLALMELAEEKKGGGEKAEGEATVAQEERREERKVRRYPIERGGQRIAVIEWDGEAAVAKLDRPIADDRKAGYVANKWAAAEKLDIDVELVKNREGQIAEVKFSPVKDEKLITDKIMRIVRWLAKNY